MTPRSRARSGRSASPTPARRSPSVFAPIALVTGTLSVILARWALVRPLKDAPLIWLFVVLSLVLLGVFLWLAASSREPAPAESPGISESKRIRTAWKLAMAGVALLAPVCLALRIFGSPPVYDWTRFPYLDKRWLVLAYWGGTFGFIVLPLALRWILNLRDARRHAGSWVGALRALDPPEKSAPDESDPRRRLRGPILRVVLGLVLATLMGGPPWHTIVPLKEVDGHEAVHWSGLQAISRGYTPYLGPASVNYGPGTQLAIYAYMKLTDTFTIPGFRESNTFLLWMTLLLVNGMIFWQLRLGPALLAWFLMFFISPVLLWQWAPMGYLYGFSGWAIPNRFLGALVLTLGVCAVVRRQNASPRSFRLGYLGLGLVWGILSYLSQETFIGGLIAVGILTALLYLTGTLRLDRVLAAIQGFLGGAIALYAPICIYYLAHGGLVAFWRNYFLVPIRFGRGYANTPWWVPFGSEPVETSALTFEPLTVAYHTLPYLVIGVTLLALYRTGRLRVAALDESRMILAAASVAFLSSFSGALLRADDFHVIGTMFAIPVVVAIALFDLPAFHTRTRIGRWTLRVLVLAITVVVFLPIWRVAPSRLLDCSRGRWHSYTLSIPPYAEEFARDEIDRRYGPSLIEFKRVQRILPALRQLKAVVGDRPVLLQIDPPDTVDLPNTVLNDGELYFCADLNIGPIWLERSDLVANSIQRRDFLEHFKTHLDGFDFVVTDMPTSPEIEAFTAAFPAGKRYVIPLLRGRDHNLYIFGKDPADR